jgi:hypothetical protein
VLGSGVLKFVPRVKGAPAEVGKGCVAASGLETEKTFAGVAFMVPFSVCG